MLLKGVEKTYPGLIITTGNVSDATIDGRILNSQKPAQDAQASVIELSSENYRREVVDSELPVIVEVYVQGCGWCRELDKEIGKIAPNYAKKVKFTRIDHEADNAELTVDKYTPAGINLYPTMLFVRDGNVIDFEIGYRKAEQLEDIIEETFDVR